jgi:lysyl-tRNA synthetase class II
MGELSIVPVGQGFRILAPSLRTVPSGTLENPDNRFRRRYLDLMLNPIVRQTFKAR